VATKAGVDTHLHAFRHFSATQAIAAGIVPRPLPAGWAIAPRRSPSGSTPTSSKDGRGTWPIHSGGPESVMPVRSRRRDASSKASRSGSSLIWANNPRPFRQARRIAARYPTPGYRWSSGSRRI